MASFVCAAAKNKLLRMIWWPIEINLPLFLSCLVEMLGEKKSVFHSISFGAISNTEIGFFTASLSRARDRFLPRFRYPCAHLYTADKNWHLNSWLLIFGVLTKLVTQKQRIPLK